MTCPCEQSCAGTNPKNALEVLKACEPTLFHKVIRPASLGDDTVTPPEQLDYKNVLLVYAANGHVYLYSSDGAPTFISYLPTDVAELKAALEKLEQDLAAEALARQNADTELMQMIEALKNSPDVVDIVNTYADLEAYDTSTLGDKDIIRVLDDETHDNASTYYRWDKAAGKWDYIGQTKPGVTLEQYTLSSPNLNQLIYPTATEDSVVIKGSVIEQGTESGEDVALSTMQAASPTLAGVMAAADKTKLDSLLDITAVGDGLTLEEGVLSATGGGSSVNLLDAYTAEPETTDIYSANYINSRLNYNTVALGNNIRFTPNPSAPRMNVAIGTNLSLSTTSQQVLIGGEISVANPYQGDVVLGYYNYAYSVGNIILGRYSCGGTTSSYIPRGTFVVGYAAASGLSDRIGARYACSAAIGDYSYCYAINSMALGGGSVSLRDNEVSVGGFPDRPASKPTWLGSNYKEVWLPDKIKNSYPATRFLANVTAGELPTDAVNLQQMQDYVAEHGGGGGVSTILYDEYTDEPAEGSAYSATYTNSQLDSEKVRIGSGTYANGFTTSDRGVLIGYNVKAIQGNAAVKPTRLLGVAIGSNSGLIGEGATTNLVGVAIGDNSQAFGASTALGGSSKANRSKSIAIGYSAKSDYARSIALGAYAETTREDEVSIGGPTAAYTTRYLANVTAGVNDTDAVNMTQLNAALARIEALEAEVEALKGN